MTTSLQKMNIARNWINHTAMPALAAGALIGLILILILMLGGCASAPGSKASILPQNLKSMDEIYKQHTQRIKPRDAQSPSTPVPKGASPQSAVPPARDQEVRPETLRYTSWDGYTRSAVTKIDNLFPTLPNPILVMHVFAHLSSTENTPVPGYATAFPMYERIEFAMPGELASRPADGADEPPTPTQAVPAQALPEAARSAAVVIPTAQALRGEGMTTAPPVRGLMTTSRRPAAQTHDSGLPVNTVGITTPTDNDPFEFLNR